MVQTQEKPDVLTAKEVAEYLRISETVVKRYASRLAIPGRQLGKEWRFSRMAVEEWLRSASGKEILLSQAGAFEDDQDDLTLLRASIYQERGRPEEETK
jgi:excisionase family DNA binding protein